MPRKSQSAKPDFRWWLSRLWCALTVILFSSSLSQAQEQEAASASVVLEDARLPAGTIIEPLGEATLSRLGGERVARRHCCTSAPMKYQISCNYIGGTSEIKRAKWELAIFDDPDGKDLTRLTSVLMELREKHKSESLARWKSRDKTWENMPRLQPPLMLCGGPGLDSWFCVVYAERRLWEWTFKGFVEGGSAFGNDNLPERVLYGDGQKVAATRRKGFTTHEKEFCSFYLTVP